MARYAQDREDLLRDAKALRHRVELRITDDDRSTIVFAGFRMHGALSLYFDQDPAYHFNSSKQLRRAYWEGQIVKAELGQLVALRTSRTEAAVVMLRHEMTADEQQQFCDQLTDRLQILADRLQKNHFEITGVVPEGSDVVDRLKTWLDQFQSVLIAETPRVA
ncbi:MAG: hypothetical protein GXP26_07415 [Planctomycetes bacterium]|nr:hypothetical protein [Planctomycetota bacterium]